MANGTTRERAAEICGQHGAIVPRVDARPTGRRLRDSLALFYREKEGDTACYRGEALWLDTEGEGKECRAWVADAHMAREVARGFPVTSLPCNNTVVEVWNTNLKVQALCMIEAPTLEMESGLLFKSFFTSVISNIFGVTSSLWGSVRESEGWEKGASCPPGFSSLGTACFLFSPHIAESSEKAASICSNRESSLAELTDQEILKEVAEYWARQRPACVEETFWWVARLPPKMVTGKNCTIGLKLRLVSSLEVTGSLHRKGDQEKEEEDDGDEGLKGAMMACRSQAKARPLCLRGRMTREEVKRQRFETFLQGLSRVVQPDQAAQKLERNEGRKDKKDQHV